MWAPGVVSFSAIGFWLFSVGELSENKRAHREALTDQDSQTDGAVSMPFLGRFDWTGKKEGNHQGSTTRRKEGGEKPIMNLPIGYVQGISVAFVLVLCGCGVPRPPTQQSSMDQAHAACDRASDCISKGKYQSAIDELNQAVEIDERCGLTCYLLGWIHATCPEAKFRDATKAIHYAEKAIQADRYFDQVGVKDKRARWMTPACLAAAYAEAGKYDKAIKATNEALEFVQYVPVEDRGVRMQELVESRLRAALKLYGAGKPLRTRKTALSKLSNGWANTILNASDIEQYPDLAD